MFDGSNRKQKRREDAIYNPIEGKWEKRNLESIDNMIHPKRENKLKMEDLKTAINGLKKNAMERSSTPPAESSSNTIKRTADIPIIKKLKDIKRRQDLHDQKYLQVSEEEYKEVKKDDSLLIIKIVAALIMLFLAMRN